MESPDDIFRETPKSQNGILDCDNIQKRRAVDRTSASARNRLQMTVIQDMGK